MSGDSKSEVSHKETMNGRTGVTTDGGTTMNDDMTAEAMDKNDKPSFQLSYTSVLYVCAVLMLIFSLLIILNTAATDIEEDLDGVPKAQMEEKRKKLLSDNQNAVYYEKVESRGGKWYFVALVIYAVFLLSTTILQMVASFMYTRILLISGFIAHAITLIAGFAAIISSCAMFGVSFPIGLGLFLCCAVSAALQVFSALILFGSWKGAKMSKEDL